MCEHAKFAVRKCPFLAQLAKEHGEEYAVNIAIEPTKPAAEPRPQGTDAVVAYAESFRLFHGPEGVLPLKKNSNGSSLASGIPAGCPYHARAERASSTVEQSASRAVPFATISLSNFGKGPNFGDFLRKQLNKGKPQRPNNSGPQQRPGPSSSAGKAPHGPGSTGSSGAIGSSNLKPQRPLGDPGASSTGSGAGRSLPSSKGRHSKPPGAAGSAYSSSSHPTLGSASTSSSANAPSGWFSTGSSSGSVRGPSPFQQQRLGSGNSSSSNTGRGPSGSGADSKGGKHSSGSSSKPGGGVVNHSSGSTALGAPGCPLRKWLGPMAGLVFNQYDKLICPPAIVAARAALAKTAAVQQLRPQALPVKLVAVAAVVAGINMPCGAVREHFEKFSVGWFIAVHATIPFVAMLRKAVIMPKYAMVVTIAAAVIGQVLGSRLERARLQYEQQHGPLLPLQFALPVAQPAAGVTQQSTVQAGRQPVHASQPEADGKGRKGSSGSAAQQRKDRGGRGTRWREQLAAEPGPAADDVLAARCGSGFAAGLFARVPSAVKA